MQWAGTAMPLVCTVIVLKQGSSLPRTPTRRARVRTRYRPLGPQGASRPIGIQKPHSPSQGRGVASFLAGAPPRRASAPGLWIFCLP